MAIQIQSSSGVVFGSAEEARKPLQIVQSPLGGNGYRLSAFTGTIGAALAASSELFQFRWLSGTKTRCVVQKVVFDGMAMVAVSTAVGPIGFMLKMATGWSIVGSGGTRIANTGENMQLETAQPVAQVNDIGIATTGALTAGTKTKHANAIGQALGGIGTAAITAYGPSSVVMPQPLLDATSGSFPIILADQEGFTIDTTHIGPAGYTYVAGFTVQWVEMAAF
jgi:hypothetical protein